MASGARGPEAPRLDTLAQPSQDAGAQAASDRLIRRARAKYITVPLAVSLAELRSPLEKSYRNTVYCAAALEQDETGRIRGTYCGNRWCLVCNRVRVARAINRYMPVIATWSSPQLVTLTVPNVKAAQLCRTIGSMLSALVAVGRSIKRTDCLPFRALRKLECTYNPERDDYHPHFHIAVEGREQAETMRRRWLAQHPDACAAAQDVRPLDRTSLKELFKYFTKVLAKRPDENSARGVAPAAALDVIFSAMKGRRVYQPMGFRVYASDRCDENAGIGSVSDTTSPTRLGDWVSWDWLQELHDWVDLSTGEVLTGYEPTPRFRDLVQSLGQPEP